MKRTPSGTSVGVDDPYGHVDRCDHLTDDGRCRYAIEQYHRDPRFSTSRREDDYACTVAHEEQDWSDCIHFRSRETDAECTRCGLTERRIAHRRDRRALLQEHHLSYSDEDPCSHEITVTLCRWCHAKVHDSWARITDDVGPDPAAIAEREHRVSLEQTEATFQTAADRLEE